MEFSAEIIAIVVIGFLLGGILKGAIGVGAPLFAVPVLAAYVDVRFAVVIFAIPNLIPNIWQSWAYRKTTLPAAFNLRFVLAGMAGAGLGTWGLANLHVDWLQLLLAGAVIAYITLRLAHPHWTLIYPRALVFAPVVGLIAGGMQTAAGLSAPVSITFMNAMQLRRETFLPTASIFFAGLGLVQLPMLVAYGLLDGPKAMLGTAALVPQFLGMPIGAWLGKRLSAKIFDRLILGLLGVLALRLIFTTFW